MTSRGDEIFDEDEESSFYDVGDDNDNDDGLSVSDVELSTDTNLPPPPPLNVNRPTQPISTVGEKYIAFSSKVEPGLGEITTMKIDNGDEKIIYKSNPEFLNDIKTFLDTDPVLSDSYRKYNPYRDSKSQASSFAGKETTKMEAISRAKLWLHNNFAAADDASLPTHKTYLSVVNFIELLEDPSVGSDWKDLDFKDGDDAAETISAKTFFETTIKGNVGWQPKNFNVVAKSVIFSSKQGIIDKLQELHDKIDPTDPPKYSAKSAPQKAAIKTIIDKLNSTDNAYDSKQLDSIKANADKLIRENFQGVILYPRGVFGFKKEPFGNADLTNFIITKKMFGFRGGKTRKPLSKRGRKTRKASNKKNKTKRRN